MNSIKIREDAMQLFANDQLGTVRAFKDGGSVWFVAKDVCNILELQNSRVAMARLDDDEKNTVCLTDGIPGNPNRTVINTSGLYTLILGSRKPQAKAFKRWVTHVVLPSIMEGKNSAGANAYVFGQEDEEDESAAEALRAAAKVTAKPPVLEAYCVVNGMVMTRAEALAWDFD